MTLTVIAKQTGIDRKLCEILIKNALQTVIKTRMVNGRSQKGHQGQLVSMNFSYIKATKYATLIADIETKEVLWIAQGKKKQVVFNFKMGTCTRVVK